MEQSRGISGNNIVTVLMQEKQIDLQTASDLVGEHFRELMDTFTKNKKNLPSWGLPTDVSVAAYVQAMEHWIIGNLEWSFETTRYFGPHYLDVRRTRIVNLRPRMYE